MYYDEQFQKWISRFFYRKAITIYSFIACLCPLALLLIYATVDGAFFQCNEFFATGLYNVLTCVFVCLAFFCWTSLSAVFILKKREIQEPLHGQYVLDEPSLIIPNPQAGDLIEELYNEARQKAKRDGKLMILLVIFIISAVYIPHLYLSYNALNQSVMDINHTGELIEEAFNDDEYTCYRSEVSTSSHVNYYSLFVNRSDTDNDLISLSINRQGLIDKINVTAHPEDGKSREALYKQVQGFYRDVMTRLQENEIPLENMSYDFHVPQALTKDFLSGQNNCIYTKTQDYELVYIYVEEDNVRSFVRMSVTPKEN